MMQEITTYCVSVYITTCFSSLSGGQSLLDFDYQNAQYLREMEQDRLKHTVFTGFL
jgi:hypothetical protein